MMKPVKTRLLGWGGILLFGVWANACASAPPAAAPAPAPKAVDPRSFGQKLASMLRLEDQRILRDPLMSALSDPSPLVRGSAAEALGLLGEPAAADAVAGLAYQVVQSGALAQLPSEEEDLKRDTPAASFRLAIYALVRLKAYSQLAGAVLDSNGQPRVRWWPVAY